MPISPSNRAKVHDERPGAFANPILASLITGGARLILAMLEREVNDRGGAFSFCDTDSLAINCGERRPDGVPCLPESEIDAIIARFDALSPYDPDIVPHLLKIEYPEHYRFAMLCRIGKTIRALSLATR